MSVQSIYGATGGQAITAPKATEKKEETKPTTSASKGFDETAVVYEKSPKPDANITKTQNNKVDREAIIAQMKADTEARMNQMQSYVQQMMNQQGIAIGTADDIWSFLASGDFTVTEAAKAQAQEAISEDGYWGVEQTSQRIIDFAKALSGGDVSKADLLLDAFKKGFEEATGTWGKELPEISQDTYKAVEEKFAAWKAEGTQTTTTTDPTTGEVVTQ